MLCSSRLPSDKWTGLGEEDYPAESLSRSSWSWLDGLFACPDVDMLYLVLSYQRSRSILGKRVVVVVVNSGDAVAVLTPWAVDGLLKCR